jgi:hypothetical protein
MQSLRGILAWLNIVVVSTTSFGGGSTIGAAQKDIPCTETKLVEQSCADVIWIGVEREKPFIAELTKITLESLGGEAHLLHQETNFVARDSAGRIRQEFRVSHGELAIGGVASSHHDLNTGASLVDDQGQLRVFILDCFGGKWIELTPETHYAIARQSCVGPTMFRPNDYFRFDPVSQLVDIKTRPDVPVEDLGYKKVEDIRAHGTRITFRGNEKAGDWKGKPVSVTEIWVSDELGATLVWSYSDLKRGTETRIALKGIKREEPDPSLFGVPSGYEVNRSK